MINFYPATVLTGGGTGALDKIDGAGLNEGDVAVVVTNSGVLHYFLNASSGEAENSPYVISPDSNAGTKRWVLQVPKGPITNIQAEQATVQSMASSTPLAMIFDTEEKDSLSEYDHTTGRFTPKHDGTYLITSTVTTEYTSWSAGFVFYTMVYKNGTEFKRGFVVATPAVSASMTAMVTIITDLVVGDYIEIYAAHNKTATVQTSAIDNRTHLGISRLIS